MALSALILLAPAFLAGQPCADAIGRQLDAWDQTEEVLRAPGGPRGGAVYRIATSTLGVWLTYHRPSRSGIQSVFRTDVRGTVRLDFGDDCHGRRTETTNPEPVEGAFTDAMLASRLAERDRLVVYLWSPHSPLSVDGYREIAEAASELDVPLVAVVDAAADAGYTRETAEANAIPADARRPLGSVELLFRDLAVHTPSVVVFSGGLASAPLPGFRLRDAYHRYLEGIFSLEAGGR